MKPPASYRKVDCCENCEHSRGTKNLPPYHCILNECKIDMTGICKDYVRVD